MPSPITDSDGIQDRLLCFIEKEVDTLTTPTTPSIFKVPDELRNGKGPYFEPKMISIGPLHADKPRLKAAKEMKKWYLKAFLRRLQEVHKSKDQLVDLLMKGLGTQTRECYRDIPDSLSNYEFFEIMLLDGCFILELLFRHKVQQVPPSPESYRGRKEEKALFYTLQQDLLKVENQIPFSVLLTLSEPLSQSSIDQFLKDAALNFFRCPKPREMTSDPPTHLLELVMFALFPCLPSSCTAGPAQATPQSSLSRARSASELRLHGINFGPRKDTHLADIKFNNGVFEIPPLEINESRTSLFWNILMFEMCSAHEYRPRVFASYVVLMDTLVNDEKDAEILLNSGVLNTRINDKNKLVSFFNDLSANVHQDEFHFVNQIDQVNRYSESGLRPLCAHLTRNYYDVRWSVLNSILLFILTVTQTLFSVLGYNPRKK